MKKRVKAKILCALSGGVDSSVAAALLVRAGYDVTAAYMVNYVNTDTRMMRIPGYADAAANACWLPDYRDAVRVAAKLGIPILKLDFTKEYKAKVLDYMFAEYKAGRTPNPDVLCNKYIKFGVWMTHARKLGFDYLATGHYARIKKVNSKQTIVNNNRSSSQFTNNYLLFTSKDTNKDQTYFLHQLSQDQLQHVLFPIGNYTKPEVRKLAQKFKLPTAEKEESMGICFIGEVPMKEFLETKIKHKPGKIILSDGTVVGKHQGLAFYTIGQRHSLPLLSKEGRPSQAGGGLPQFATTSPNSSRLRTGRPATPGPSLERRGDSKPLYVLAKYSKTNELVVGYEDDPLLYTKEIIVTDVNWIGFIHRSPLQGVGGQTPKFPLKCEVRLRHRQPLQRCVVKGERRKEKGAVSVEFDKPQRAVTPGQFAVFYSARHSSKGAKVGERECLGGGVIA